MFLYMCTPFIYNLHVNSECGRDVDKLLFVICIAHIWKTSSQKEMIYKAGVEALYPFAFVIKFLQDRTS